MSHQDCSEYLEIAKEQQERAFISRTLMKQSMSDESTIKPLPLLSKQEKNLNYSCSSPYTGFIFPTGNNNVIF